MCLGRQFIERVSNLALHFHCMCAGIDKKESMPAQMMGLLAPAFMPEQALQPSWHQRGMQGCHVP